MTQVGTTEDNGRRVAQCYPCYSASFGLDVWNLWHINTVREIGYGDWKQIPRYILLFTCFIQKVSVACKAIFHPSKSSDLPPLLHDSIPIPSPNGAGAVFADAQRTLRSRASNPEHAN